MKKKVKNSKVVISIDLPKVFKSPSWGKLVNTQQLIAYLLINLINTRCRSADKNFKEWFKKYVEKQTLGQLTNLFKKIVAPDFKGRRFKIYRPRGYIMEEITKLMEDYCEKRNKLFHKVIQTRYQSRKEILLECKSTNKTGDIILTVLEILWKEEINRYLGELGKKVGKEVKRIESQSKKVAKVVKKHYATRYYRQFRS